MITEYSFLIKFFHNLAKFRTPKNTEAYTSNKNKCCKNTKHLQNGPPMSFIKALSSFLSQAIFLGENFHCLGNQKKIWVWTMPRILYGKIAQKWPEFEEFLFFSNRPT